MYEPIIGNTIAIVFLGSPHRGVDLTTLLKGLLNVTFSNRPFVKDLAPASQSLKEINDAFAERTEGFEIASFWESVGISPVGVLMRFVRMLMRDRSARIFSHSWIPRRGPGPLEWKSHIDNQIQFKGG